MEEKTLNPSFESFLQKLERINSKEEEKEKIHVNELAGNIYFVYEKVRNAIEYKEQHLFRRSAIERLIKRKVFLHEDKLNGLGLQIIKELIKTRYLQNNTLPLSKTDEIDKILEKYHVFYKQVKNSYKKNAHKYLRNILLMAACEVECSIWNYEKEEAYLNFVYNNFLESFEANEEIDPHVLYASVYFAVHRSLWKSDLPTIEYYLFKNSFPEWNSKNLSIEKMVDSYFSFRQFLNKVTDTKTFPRIQALVRKNIAPYKIIRLAILKQNLSYKVAEKENFLSKTNQILVEEYNRIKEKTNRRIIQSIIYIFLTKVLLAILLEFPYDYLVEGYINYLPLTINLVFPPSFMLLLGILIAKPTESNTNEIRRRIKKIIYGEPKELLYKLSSASKKIGPIFTFLYLLTFFGSFYLAIYALMLLQFNMVSGLVFFIFFSTVSFFGYRVSQGAKELILIEKKKTIKEVLLDFLTFPFIKLGQWLSDKYSRINVFVFIFDYIIEIPLKTFLGLFEDWSSFINKEKEKLLDQ